ncbi:DHHC palmitoyltransferase-domain-containing protein [Sporodiniella umbellata]|nr:DHHC palmitoyltransferase-domain-containing protein [Sporodiniella umbellata]
MPKCSSLKKVQFYCMAGVNASPVALLLLIFTWSFLAFNFCLSWAQLISKGYFAQGFFYLVVFQPLFFLCMWSYWAVCRTSPGYTAELYKQKGRVEEEGRLLDTSELRYSITVKRDGAKRFCQKCKLEKFDRTHHCRQCGKCVLKMDHHCPWVNNCVGFHNYKAFYLFLVYASLYCLWIFITCLPPTIRIVNENILELDVNLVLMVFVSGIFGLFLIPFTLFHTRQLFKNRTTIEFYEKSNFMLGRNDVMRTRYFNPWDIGTRKNIEQVLGRTKLEMFIPIGQP